MSVLDLDLDVTGLSAPLPTLELGRELSLADADVVNSRAGKPSSLRRLSSRHHTLARLIAEGMKQSEAAIAAGYTPQNAVILMKDQSFLELVESYRNDIRARFLDMQSALAGVAIDAVETLRERLEADPDKVTNATLIEIAKLGADRSGFGPTTKTEQKIDGNIAVRLDEARRRVQSRLIDVTPTPAVKGPADA